MAALREDSSAVDIVSLSTDRIDINGVIASVQDTSAGATSSFIGTTRDNFEGFYTFVLLDGFSFRQ